MKKATSKILMAVMALVVAIGIATGTTFAWFSMNTEVSATGLSISAKSDSTFLVIEEGSTFHNTTTTTSVTSSAADVELYPVTPATTLTSSNVTTAASWKYAYSNSNGSSTKSGDYTVCTSLTDYVASETFSIGLNDTSGVATSANNIRLTNVDLPDNTGISCVVVCDSVIGTYTADSSTPLDLGVKATKTGTVVTVYYFINGEDVNVYSDNAAALTGAVTLTFDVNA